MISLQGSQRNMLREEFVFDISAKQLGHNGFMVALENSMTEYSVCGETVPTRDAKKSAEEGRQQPRGTNLTAVL